MSAPRPAQFLANQNLNSMVIQASDGSQSLSQFIGDRIITQFANNLGNLALAFPNVANSVLFANGATTASPVATQQFNQMVTPALGLAASTLANELQLLPNSTSIMPALQTAIFGTTGTTGTTSSLPTSVINALEGLPITSTDFPTAASTAFTTALSNVTGILSPFVGTFPTPTVSLNTTLAPSVFNTNLTSDTFQSGFLGGFGSGFTGFGTAPTTLNTNFGTGFNNFVSTTNSSMGFITPPVNVGTGVVGTVGVTTGNGATSTGTGTTSTTGGTSGNGTSG